VWSVGVALLALSQPNVFIWLGGDSIPWGLGFIMLGMGITLGRNDYIKVLKSPKTIILGVSMQFLIMPAWSAFLAWSFQLPPDLAVGLILVACCPGGTASNVVVFLARARVALSIALTMCSTIIAVLLTPWLTYFYAGHYLPIEPWSLLKSILLIVLIPLFIGTCLNHFFPETSRKVASVSPIFSVLFILLIVGFILATKRDAIMDHGGTLLFATGLLHIGGFTLGYFIARFLKRDPQECQTISVEVGMQNSGLGAALATKHFPGLVLAPASCAMSAILHCIIGSLLAARWAYTNRRALHKEKKPQFS